MSNRDSLVEKYLAIRREHDKIEERLKKARIEKIKLLRDYSKTEDNLKAI